MNGPYQQSIEINKLYKRRTRLITIHRRLSKIYHCSTGDIRDEARLVLYAASQAICSVEGKIKSVAGCL